MKATPLDSPPAGTEGAAAAAPSRRLRVVVLCSDDPQHDFLLSELGRTGALVGAIVEPGTAQQRTLWRRRRYADWAFRAYQVRRQRMTGRSRYRRAYFLPLVNPGCLANVPRVVVNSVNSELAREALAQLRPDVTVVCGTLYIGRSTLQHAGLAINIHGGHLPEYRGNHCVFFAFRNRDFGRIAATLHVVSAQLDGGDVIEVVQPEIYPHDNDEHLYCRSLHRAILRLVEILDARQPEDIRLAARPQPEAGALYRHRSRTPRIELGLWLRRRLGLHAVPHLVPCSRVHVRDQ